MSSEEEHWPHYGAYERRSDQKLFLKRWGMTRNSESDPKLQNPSYTTVSPWKIHSQSQNTVPKIRFRLKFGGKRRAARIQWGGTKKQGTGRHM
jgi:hypothetical protein